MSDDESGMAAVLAEHRWGGCIGPSTDEYPLGRYARCAGCDWTGEYDPANLFATHEAHQSAALAEAGYGHVGQARGAGWDACARDIALGALNSATHEAALRAMRNNPYHTAREAGEQHG